MAVSFDLFGTLVSPDPPADPASAIAAELTARGVSVPDDWGASYAHPHLEIADGHELALTDHVAAALASAGDPAERSAVEAAVFAAFDRPVEMRAGALEAVDAARAAGPVAICSNCSVSGLVEHSLERAGIGTERFDAVVSSVDCGWRKPAPEIFLETASALGVEPAALLHVGDDPQADGGVERVGGTAVSVTETPLSELGAVLETSRAGDEP
ncbi:HAD family hydrolase [Natronobiforma cellulositropha]|uniref:HAD family hydrolase n=1 Tax=Natronobiforma cellulositropha TaxID=1679076 RepID=UPI0021D5EA8F|nr:HAD family hydrolase [Natronobiforma cellulositropha]